MKTAFQPLAPGIGKSNSCSKEIRMKSVGIAAVAVLVSLVNAHAGDDAALKRETDALQGKWNWVKTESKDKKPEDFKGATMEFLKDGKTTVFAKGEFMKKGVLEIN